MDIRYSCNQKDFKRYTTEEVRNEFLITDLYKADEMVAVYSHVDRMVTLGCMPVNEVVSIDKGIDIWANFGTHYFLERREIGIFNIGDGAGTITADGVAGPKTLLYLGLGGSSSGNSTGYSDADVELLAKVISAEARGESYEGQVAVGAVILNRVAHPSFPNSISGVVYQNGAFSCVNDSNWYAPVADSAKRAATDALNGWDPSGGAVYYFNASKTSDKFMHSRPVIKVIGNHKFCS